VTEAEWLAATDPRPIPEWVRDQGIALGVLSCACCRVRCRLYGPDREPARCPLYRKLRLFSVSCCRRILHVLPDAICQELWDHGKAGGSARDGWLLAPGGRS
jgi:hypothetical protein